MCHRGAIHDDCPEVEFENALVRAATAHGWRVHCERAARDADGSWSTAIKGHVGFPDVSMVHPTRGIVFAELKSRRGKLGPGQEEWARDLAGYDTAESFVLYEIWRPADWEAIVVCLELGVHAYRYRFREPVASPATTTV